MNEDDNRTVYSNDVEFWILIGQNIIALIIISPCFYSNGIFIGTQYGTGRSLQRQCSVRLSDCRVELDSCPKVFYSVFKYKRCASLVHQLRLYLLPCTYLSTGWEMKRFSPCMWLAKKEFVQ